MMRTATVLMASIACVMLVGCGEKDTIAGDTPQATAEDFVEAMQAGEYDRVAEGFEFETYARENNEDWDSIPSGQRNQIIGELRGNQARELESLAGMFAGGDASVGNVQQQGDSATAVITTGANQIMLQMTQMEGKWLITTMSEQAG